MPTTLNFNTQECNECGIIIPFNNVVLDRQKDYSVTFTAVSSLPNCTTAVEPAIHSFVPTQTSSTLYTSLLVSGCDNRSTTLVKMSVTNNEKEVYTDYVTVLCGVCPKDAPNITPTPSTSIGVTPTQTPGATPPPTPTPSSLVAFSVEFSTHMIDIDCDSKDPVIFAKLQGNKNRKYSYEFSALNNNEFVSFGNQSGEIFMSELSMNITTTISVGSAQTETLVKCRVKDLETQYIGDTISVIKCINN